VGVAAWTTNSSSPNTLLLRNSPRLFKLLPLH